MEIKLEVNILSLKVHLNREFLHEPAQRMPILPAES